MRKKAKVDLTRDEIEGTGRADKFRILTTTIPKKHNDSSIDDVVSALISYGCIVTQEMQFAWADLRPEHKVYGHKLPVRYPDYVGIGENILDETLDLKGVRQKHSDDEKSAILIPRILFLCLTVRDRDAVDWDADKGATRYVQCGFMLCL